MNRILVPTDFSGGAHLALAAALDLARRREADVHVLHVAPVYYQDELQRFDQANASEVALYRRLWDEAEKKLHEAVALHDTRGVQVKQVLARGIAAAPVILDYARKEGAGLIVIGTHGRRGLRRYMLGSVAEEVLAEADIPVLAVREGTAEQHRAVQRVLVPVDLSDLSEPLVREAAAFCEPFGAHVDLVNVVEPLPLYVSAVGGVTLFDLVPNVVEETREELRRLAERAVGPRLPVEAHVVEGDAPREIVKLAESLNSDLIVMTRQSLTHLERLIMGSVTARVLRSAPCPVLVVPTPEPSEPPADS